MTKSPSLPEEALSQVAGEFSLFLGGPLFQLLRRAHLAGDALTLARRRVVVIALLVWLPLLVLTAIQGRLLPGRVPLPFLYDVEAHVRFLVVIPLLIVAELVVHQRMRPVVNQFLNERLIPENASFRFEEAVASAFRLRNSVPAELLMILFVYGFGFVWRRYLALDTSTWYATPSAEGLSLTLAGDWYLFVSLPVAQFLLVRWYFRMYIWARFLWKVSRIDLRLIPTHPDRTGGLGFLSNIAYAFMPLAAAHGALLSGWLANRILYLGVPLPQFKAEIGIVVILVLLLVFVPLLPFGPQLSRTKRRGALEYGALGQRYVREFDRKWLRGGAPDNEPLLGSADIQSLADLANSVEVVRSMLVIPVTKGTIVRLVVATLVPVAPLLLTMMPAEELLKRLLGVLF
ncbi:MAG: hypothetical protein ACLPJH_19370 [Myxococcaceae bacterium]